MESAPPSAEVSTESSELQFTSPSPDAPMTDSLHDNFEEFHLDSENNSDENDEGILNRKSGDGAEKVAKVASCSVQGSYEGFLEATGLSQKSILTPSRLNSHRTVLRPRDIKYRSKANRTFCNGAVKYWSGPYLWDLFWPISYYLRAWNWWIFVLEEENSYQVITCLIKCSSF